EILDQGLDALGPAQIASRQMLAFRPIAGHLRTIGFELLEGVFGKLAVGGDLAAEHRQKRRLAGVAVDVQDIVAGNRGRIGGIIVIEGPDPGKGLHDIAAPELPLAVAIDHGKEIIDFAIVDGDVFWSAFIRNVGGADEAEIVLIGIDEDYPLVVILEKIGLWPIPEFRHYDMAALDEADAAA